jgi:iron-sulfur cluster assembly protein
MTISMTPAAQEHVRNHLASRGKGEGIRVGVKASGCSGLSYVLDYVDEADPGDTVIQCGDVKLFVDPECMTYLDGSELDFVKDGLNQGLQFNNPNVVDECGCGESFHV